MIFYLKKIIISLCLMSLGALVLLGFLISHDSSSKSGTVEFIDNTYWIHAPDGSTGIKFIKKNHPLYRVKIFWDTPQNIAYDGTMKYIGDRTEPVCVFESQFFDGTRLHLIPGGYLERYPPDEDE